MLCGQVLLVTSLTYPSLWVLPSGEQHLVRAEDGYLDPDKVQVAAPAPRAPRASPWFRPLAAVPARAAPRLDCVGARQ